MKKWLMMVSVGLLLMLAVVGCGSQETTSGDKEESSLKVGLVLTGSKTDGGWCQIAYEGVEQMRDELGAEIFYSEGTKATDYEKSYERIC